MAYEGDGMRLNKLFVACAMVAVALSAQSQGIQKSARGTWRLEAKGDPGEAREQLRKSAAGAPNDPLALEAYADFLSQHRDPAAREAYEKVYKLLSRNGASAGERARVARRLAELDLIAGDRAAAASHLEGFRSAGGSGLSLPSAIPPGGASFIEIPGPLRSFERLAAISPDAAPEEVLASLAHNITLNGYAAMRASESLEPTEYLNLITRYLTQARELEKLAGPEK